MMFWTQRRNNDFDISILNKLSEDLTNAITNSKLANHRQIAFKANDLNSAPKTYWSILKSFVNGRKILLTIYRPMFPSYRSQSVDLRCKSTDWFLYDGNIGR